MHIEFGSDLDTNSNNKYILKEYINLDWLNDAYTFQNSRSALNLIAKICKQSGYKTIFMPSICCHSMIQPFEFNNINVVFYPLNKDFSINQNFINSKISSKDILLYFNYLGLKEESTIKYEQLYLSELKSNYKYLKIIQDCTQSLDEVLYKKNLYGDYIICSIRKWASFPDGGLLFTNENLDFLYDNYESKVFDLKKKALDLKSEYLISKKQEDKNQFLKLFKEADEIIDTSNSIIDISPYSKKLLYNLDFKTILEKRNQNSNYINKYITSFSSTSLGSGLYFPIYTDNQKSMQYELAKRNIFCPVIWPLNEKIVDDFIFIKDITSHILAVPCDQRYNKEDLDYIIKSILECSKITNSEITTFDNNKKV